MDKVTSGGFDSSPSEFLGLSLIDFRCFAARSIQNGCCAWIHQQCKAIAKLIGLGIDGDQDGAFTANTATQNASQAEQRTAAAYLASLPSAVADDFAVGAKDSFQKRNGGKNRFIPINVCHGTLSTKLAVFGQRGKYLIKQETAE